MPSAAAGASISEIFAEHGESYFRQGERKVIKRLLEGGPQVLATGGGAYMNAETRANITARGLSIWLKADLKVLLKRVGRRDNRPLLAGGEPEKVMKKLIEVIDALAAKLGCQVKADKTQGRKKVK